MNKIKQNLHIKVRQNKQTRTRPRTGTRNRDPLVSTLKNPIKTLNWKL